MPLRRNRWVARLAAFAMALQALWPLLAQARPKAPSLQVPFCTFSGTTHYIDLSSGNSPAKEPGVFSGEHCKLCVFGGDKAASVRLHEGIALLLETSAPDDSLYAVALSDHPYLLPAQPRAPPQAS